MLKAMAILRTVILVFLVAYLIWELPIALLVFSGSARAAGVNVNVDMVKQVAGVAWLAIGWIALETALAWGRAWSAGRAARKASSPVAPPAAVPPGTR
jgi:signal transduction histidine kinase